MVEDFFKKKSSEDKATLVEETSAGSGKIVMAKLSAGVMPKQEKNNYGESDQDMNFQAFLKEKEMLQLHYSGNLVAYSNGKRIAEGVDSDDLLEKIPEEYKDSALFITEVPLGMINFRRPLRIGGEMKQDED